MTDLKFNNTALGYLTMGMIRSGYSLEDIKKMRSLLSFSFDEMTLSQAEKINEDYVMGIYSDMNMYFDNIATKNRISKLNEE